MAEYKFCLKQPPASEFVDKLASVVVEVSPGRRVTGFSCSTNSGSMDLLNKQGGVEAGTIKDHQPFKDGYALLSARPFLDLTGAHISTDDGTTISSRYDKDNGFYIALNVSDQRGQNLSSLAPISDALHRHFNLLRKQEALENTIPDSEKAALQTARTILLDFASQRK